MDFVGILSILGAALLAQALDVGSDLQVVTDQAAAGFVGICLPW